MSVLVTGAAGFLGSRLARKLLASGEHVRVLVRQSGSVRALDGLDVEVVRGDASLEDDVYRALTGIDRVYHVAGTYTYVGRADDILRANVASTDVMMRMSAKRGVQRVVVTSSVAAIGSTLRAVEMDETQPWTADDDRGLPYVVAKRRAEERALEWAGRDLDVVVVNPCGVYGPGDWKPTPSGAVVLRMLRSGVPAYAPGGVSYADVDDIADGHRAAMERGLRGQRYILGGENLTHQQFLGTLAELCGRSAPRFATGKAGAALAGLAMQAWGALGGRTPEMTFAMASQVGRWWFVTSAKAEKELGYTHRPARETLSRAVRWYIENGYTTPAGAS